MVFQTPRPNWVEFTHHILCLLQRCNLPKIEAIVALWDSAGHISSEAGRQSLTSTTWELLRQLLDGEQHLDYATRRLLLYTKAQLLPSSLIKSSLYAPDQHELLNRSNLLRCSRFDPWQPSHTLPTRNREP